MKKNRFQTPINLVTGVVTLLPLLFTPSPLVAWGLSARTLSPSCHRGILRSRPLTPPDSPLLDTTVGLAGLPANPECLDTFTPLPTAISVIPKAVQQFYFAREGDTWERVAARYHCELDDLLHLNDSTEGLSLKFGQRVRLPFSPHFRIAHPEEFQIPKLELLAEFHPPLKGELSSMFGERFHPISFNRKFHPGVDIRAKKNTPVYAVAPGKVIYSGWSNGYGRLMVIDHEGGLRTRYGHLNKFLLDEGAVVKAGDPIGLVGNSGNTTGTHLHFEIRYQARSIDPLKFLKYGPLEKPAKTRGKFFNK